MAKNFDGRKIVCGKNLKGAHIYDSLAYSILPVTILTVVTSVIAILVSTRIRFKATRL